MAIYQEKINREVEAVQFTAGKTDAAVKGATVLVYDLAKDEKDSRCPTCGHLMSEHGKKIGIGEDFSTICPGTYIVNDDGKITYRTEADFLKRYEAVTSE